MTYVLTNAELTAGSAGAVEETGAVACADGFWLLVDECVLPARAVSVGRIRAELAVALERERVAANRRTDIALFVSEACTNVMVHAYVGTSPGPLYAAATLADRDLIVSVCDCGRGMVAHPDIANRVPIRSMSRAPASPVAI